MSNVLRVAAAGLVAASIACAQTGPGAAAINPPTLTPRATATRTPTLSPSQGPTIQPAAALSKSELQINQLATVHTTEGDKLRVHSRPSYDAPVVFKLDNGTAVTVIAGPQVIGPDRWWQIQTADGQSGWAVDEAEGVQTLVPGG